MAKVVVLTGGGIKGAVTAARYAAGHQLYLVHAQYGQVAAQAEATAIKYLAGKWPDAHLIPVRLPHVTDLDRAIDGISGTPAAVNDVGPRAPSPASRRGLTPVLLSVGIQCALRAGASVVATGLSRFCDASFIGLTDAAAMLGNRHEIVHSFDILAESISRGSHRVRVEAPLMELALPDILRLGRRIDLPFEDTWSCAQGEPLACGDCEPCRARANAFAEAGLLDPLAADAPAST